MILNIIKIPTKRREPVITTTMVRLMERRIKELGAEVQRLEESARTLDAAAERQRTRAAMVRNYIFAEAPDLVERAEAHINRVRP